jgi:hypothetical protein
MPLPLIQSGHRSLSRYFISFIWQRLQTLCEGILSHFSNEKEPDLTVLTEVKSILSSEKSYLETKLIL